MAVSIDKETFQNGHRITWIQKINDTDFYKTSTLAYTFDTHCDVFPTSWNLELSRECIKEYSNTAKMHLKLTRGQDYMPVPMEAKVDVDISHLKGYGFNCYPSQTKKFKGPDTSFPKSVPLDTVERNVLAADLEVTTTLQVTLCHDYHSSPNRNRFISRRFSSTDVDATINCTESRIV